MSASREADRGSAASAKANILIVDDKPKNLLALKQMLADLGETIVEAGSGSDALRFLLRHDAAIVLLDVQMPDIDGYELASLIRARERSRHTPIIFITAFDKDDEEIARGYRLGAVDYVFKPINSDILKAKVSVFVDLHKKTEAVRAQAEQERRLQLENLRVRTEKLEAERALRQIEERQSLIIRSLPIALYTAALSDEFNGPRFLSEGIAETVGFKPADFIADPALWAARINPADLPRVLAKLGEIGETGGFSVEYRWRCADGSERTFLDQATLVRDAEDGRPQGIVGTCLDVTYRRQLEQQLHQSQKMDAVGQLTGGIAHDFNNMLSIIIWNLDLISRSLKGSGKDFDRAQNALGAALNCADLIRQLLTFARHQPQRMQVIDLAELVPRLARLLVPVVGERVRLTVEFTDEPWPIYADRAQIESALVNLALNARDAMGEGGTLAIRCGNVPEGGATVAEPLSGDCVVLAVTDTGTGMAPDVVERAFEPFFTTKEAGKGTGLGLSMVYGFVKQIGGQVAIESALGAGTTVSLYLPRAASGEEDEAEDGHAAPIIDLACTVLVVEDNASIRSMTCARLRELGATVLEAENAPAALEALSGDTSIDVLFTDVVMHGGMSGIELAHRARELRPEIKVILASGYAAMFPTTGGVAAELLQKPYRDEDLLHTLRKALDRED